MLISQKAHDANVRNAQKSTGPKTPEGKDAVRFNALTYGLRTREILLPDENAAPYFQFWDEMQAEWQPEGRREFIHLEDMVQSQWLLKRLADTESEIWCIGDLDRRLKMLSYVARKRGALERTYYKAMNAMKQSQKERRQSRRPEPRPKPMQKAPAPEPPRSYVMSEPADAQPMVCAPATTPGAR